MIILAHRHEIALPGSRVSDRVFERAIAGNCIILCCRVLGEIRAAVDHGLEEFLSELSVIVLHCDRSLAVHEVQLLGELVDRVSTRTRV